MTTPRAHGVSEAAAPRTRTDSHESRELGASSDEHFAARHNATFSLLARVAWRSLRSARMSLALMVLAVALGTALQIPNAANLAGYNDELLTRGIRFGRGDVLLRPERGMHLAWNELAPKLQALPFVHAVIPKLILPGGVTLRGKTEGVPIVGLSPGQDGLRLTLRGGEPAVGPIAKDTVLLGTKTAEALGVQLGDLVFVRALVSWPGDKKDALTLDDKPVSTLTLRVAGLVTGQFGNAWGAYVDRQVLLREMGEEDAASLVSVYTDAPSLAREHADRVAAALRGHGVKVAAWQSEDDVVQTSISGNEKIGALSIVMVLIAVTLPVWALLYIRTHARRTEIALLCALGFSRRDVFACTLMQGATVGLAGVLLGALVGYALCIYFAAHPIFEMEGFAVRPLVTWETILRPVAFVFAAALLGAVTPGIAAARVAPATALRSAE